MEILVGGHKMCLICSRNDLENEYHFVLVFSLINVYKKYVLEIITCNMFDFIIWYKMRICFPLLLWKIFN
jgi:hypothetical protein